MKRLLENKYKQIIVGIVLAIICLLVLHYSVWAKDFESVVVGASRFEVWLRLGIPDYIDRNVHKTPHLYGGAKFISKYPNSYAYRYDDTSWSLFVCLDSKTNTVINVMMLNE